MTIEIIPMAKIKMFRGRGYRHDRLGFLNYLNFVSSNAKYFSGQIDTPNWLILIMFISHYYLINVKPSKYSGACTNLEK